MSTYNSYKEYFNAEFSEYWGKNKTKTDVYKEHLSTASKEELIDLAIEGNQNYNWANDLAYQRGLEIEELKIAHQQEINNLNSQILYQKQISLLLIIIICFILVCNVIKNILTKYKEKIRKEINNKINNNPIS